MTFFNKKTEVMQIEMTPYGRYLYSIGKFKPHSYEFVDDDILYRASGSTEVQEAAHSRIINETPKLKINRAYQDEGARQTERIAIDEKRVLQKKMTQRQNGLSSLGRSSYSSDNMPSFQVTMLQGTISGSSKTFETNRTFDGVKAEDISGSVHIPQIDVDIVVETTLKNLLRTNAFEGSDLSSDTFDDGYYIDISYDSQIIHLKEFNSFYEKENFEIEVFLSASDGTLQPMKMEKAKSFIVNDILIDGEPSEEIIENRSNDFMEYYFDIEVDRQIDPEELCRVVEKLEINNQFLDEELICPDQRTDRFDIYATRVGPEDLEDCD
jgi:hypothetical protein